MRWKALGLTMIEPDPRRGEHIGRPYVIGIPLYAEAYLPHHDLSHNTLFFEEVPCRCTIRNLRRPWECTVAGGISLISLRASSHQLKFIM